MSRLSKKYGELYYQHVPSLSKIIKEAIIDKVKVSHLDLDLPRTAIPIAPEHMEFFYFALVVDGEVKEILKVNKEVANLFNKEFQLVEYRPEIQPVNKGTKFVDGKFVE